MTTAPMLQWRGFVTLRVSARWTGDEGDREPIWQLYPLDMTTGPDQRRAFVVHARMVLREDGHEITTQLAIRAMDDETSPLPHLDVAEQREVALTVNRLLWDRSTVVAKAVAGLTGVSLSPLILPPEPDVLEVPMEGEDSTN